MIKKYEKKYEVTYRDADARQECHLTSYMDFMADCGMSQENNLGFSFFDLIDNNQTWVLYDYNINVYKYAKYRDVLKIVTYVDSIKKFYAVRNFKVYNDKNELIVEGKTVAFLIDTIKRKTIMIPQEYYEAYGVDIKTGGVSRTKFKISKLENIDYEKNFNVRYIDIDINSHVGNVKYVSWIMETMPIDIIKNYRVSHLKIKYEIEIPYGSDVKAQTEIRQEEENLIAIHQILKDGEVVAFLESNWTKHNVDVYTNKK